MPGSNNGESSTHAGHAKAKPAAPAQKSMVADEEDWGGQIVRFLENDLVSFAKDHFDTPDQKTLTTVIKKHGGRIAEGDEQPSILLVNPCCDNYPTTVARQEKKKRKHPEVGHPTITPYHWLYHCRYEEKRVPLDELPHAQPILTHPGDKPKHAPLRIWVSLSIHRFATEDSMTAAHLKTKETIYKLGGFVVNKRFKAEILLVDRSSKNWNDVVAPTLRDNPRPELRIAERDWLEECSRQNRMTWPLPEGEEKEQGEEEEEEEPEESDDGSDSMVNEDDRKARTASTGRNGRGPGRPPGQPRVEYNGEDDDFMCKYLAYYHPEGSWLSKKTYELMAEMEDKYPIVSRHTVQSWMEHFKKKAPIWSHRVNRYKEEGLDEELRTAAERNKLKGKRKNQPPLVVTDSDDSAAEEPVARAPRPQANGKVRAKAVARGESDEVEEGRRTVAEREGARLTRIAAEFEPIVRKRTLVVVESDDDDDAGDVEAVIGATTSHAAEPPQGPSRGTVQPAEEAAGPRESTVSNQDTGGPSDMGPKTDLGFDGDNADFTDPAPQQQVTAAEAGNAEQGPSVLGQQPVQQRDQEVEKEPEQPVQPKVVPSIDRTAIVDKQGPADNGHVPPTMRTPSPRRQPPLELGDGEATGFADDAKSITTSRLKSPPFDLLRKLPAGKLATPSGQIIKRTALMSDEIMASAQNRRRTLDRASMMGSSTKKRSRLSTSLAVEDEVHTPDMVIASTRFPPARTSIEPLKKKPKVITPRLTSEEREELKARGKTLVMAQKDLYKERISFFCAEYGVSPSQLATIINNLPKTNAGGDTYWSDISDKLKIHFARG